MSVATLKLTTDGSASARVMELPHAGAAIVLAGPHGSTAATLTAGQARELAAMLLNATHDPYVREVVVDLDRHRMTTYHTRSEPVA